MLKFIAYSIATVLGLYILHKLALFLEAKGWIYYKEKPRGSGVGNALEELNSLMNPSVKHVVEVKKEVKEEDSKADDKDSR